MKDQNKTTAPQPPLVNLFPDGETKDVRVSYNNEDVLNQEDLRLSLGATYAEHRPPGSSQQTLGGHCVQMQVSSAKGLPPPVVDNIVSMPNASLSISLRPPGNEAQVRSGQKDVKNPKMEKAFGKRKRGINISCLIPDRANQYRHQPPRVPVNTSGNLTQTMPQEAGSRSAPKGKEAVIYPTLEDHIRSSVISEPVVSVCDSHGKLMKGVLLKYSKVEEIIISCACHGRCFNAMGFLFHAGMGVVENPLQHITVTNASGLY